MATSRMQHVVEELSTPAPIFEDPEDEDIVTETIAKICTGDGEVEDGVSITGGAASNRRVVSLSDTDPRYRGHIASRKTLMGGWSEQNSSNENDYDSETSVKSIDDESDDEDDEYDHVSDSNSKEKETEGTSDGKTEDGDDDDSHCESEEEHDIDLEVVNDDSNSSEDDSQRFSADKDAKNDVKGSSSLGNIHDHHFGSAAKVDIAEEVAKGVATRNQLVIWEHLLQCRIKLQKLVAASNRLPTDHAVWTRARQAAVSRDVDAATQQCVESLRLLLSTLLNLQQSLYGQYPGTKRLHNASAEEALPHINGVEGGEKKRSSGKKRSASQQRDIASSDDGDMETVISKRSKYFTAFRDEVIEKWNDKTRLARTSIRNTSKDFSAFNQSTLQQIQQILSDKERIIKRTQLRRSSYRIIGEESPSSGAEESYNENVFDDSDFYQQLLRDLIHSRTGTGAGGGSGEVGGSAELDVDPLLMGRQWLEIQRLRSKHKKPVDTKASKGRKVRYEVHKKLVNFMSPMSDHSQCRESQISRLNRNELSSSLFGAKPASYKLLPPNAAAPANTS